ncbi:MAG: polymer-forming cytoskeletal protein [Thermomicrobiales bacterium]
MNQMDNATVPGGSSYIDPDSTVEGTIRTDHDLRVEGSVAGTIQCEGVLIVAEGRSSTPKSTRAASSSQAR